MTKINKYFLIAFGVIVLIGALAYAVSFSDDGEEVVENTIPDAGEVTVEGTITCLPHRGDGIATTLECAYGLEDDDGQYFALRDPDPEYRNISNAPMGVRLTVSGVFSPEPSGIYRDIGFITIETITMADVPVRTTLTGTMVCLPHKEGVSPTKECMQGLKTADGLYYGLDFGTMSQTPPSFGTGDAFSANGILVPIDQMSTDEWKKYAIEGIFSVTDSAEKI